MSLARFYPIFDTADWSEHAHVENAIDPETAAPPASGHGSRVSMAVGGEPAQVFLSHADSQSIIVVDVETGTLATPLALSFPPGKLTWVGLSEEHDDHGEEEHAHDEEHDHDH